MAFGDHLRADQDVERVLAEAGQDGFEAPLAGDGIAIEARDARFRKRTVQFVLDALRTGAEKVDILAAALWTNVSGRVPHNRSNGTACGGRGDGK